MKIELPRWAVPLQQKKRYKLVKGGRGSGKSHERAIAIVLKMISEPDSRIVCLRQVQKSIKYSSKQLIKDKIIALGVSHLFKITETEISRIDGDGFAIFLGMQDHTADSIKSLEGFDVFWFEEAQKITQYSLDILIPTIRKAGSEFWATWNPKKEKDAIEKFARDEVDDAIIVHVNYPDNPFCPEETRLQAEKMKDRDYAKYKHIYLGGYDVKDEAQIFGGCYEEKEFDINREWAGPYQGMDWGFSLDPTTAIRAWIDVENNDLYISHEAGRVGLTLDDTPKFIIDRIPNFERYKAKADNARPESINQVKNNKVKSDDGVVYRLPLVVSCKKGKGSVEDGIEFIKSFNKVYIHPRCPETINEFDNYSYKTDRITEEVLSDILDENNHYIDALRYALEDVKDKTLWDVW